MMMFYAQQDTFGGTACGASFAARTAMFSLIILGTALAVSLFILLDPVVLALSVLILVVLPVIVMVRSLGASARPRNRRGVSYQLLL